MEQSYKQTGQRQSPKTCESVQILQEQAVKTEDQAIVMGLKKFKMWR